MKTLVVLESGTKTTYFKKYLDTNKYIIDACYGHIRDLEQKKMSIDIENNFKPTYKIISSKKNIISGLKKKMSECDSILLACDNDREGESISWHVSEILKIKPCKRKRLIFNEITKSAILECIKNPVDLDMNMVYAQQTRRLLDRLIGFTISPILWKHIKNSYEKKLSLSAGRVQSVVLKLIIEREKEIGKFKSKNTYKINSVFKKDSQDVRCDLNKEIPDIKETQQFLKSCQESVFSVTNINKNKLVSKPPLPFITSSLQQEANSKFSMSPKITMSHAQKLYEKGFITYHRTDSVILSQEAKDKIKDYITHHFGEEYYNEKDFKNKTENCQEAHEAIRPSNISMNEIDDDTNPNEKKLYKLIWNRTIASLMANSKTEITSSHIKGDKINKYYFIYKTNKTLFDGFQKLYISDEDKPKNIKLNKNDILSYINIKGTEKYSSPSKLRYTEASLIKKLEDLGIGRPSTYANMVGVVQERNYVEKKDVEGRDTELNILSIKCKDNTLYEDKIKTKIGSEKQKMVSTDIGNIVNRFMVQHFDAIINYKYTSVLEEKLDEIAKGKLVWYEFLKNVYTDLRNTQIILMDTALEKDRYKKILGKYPGTNNDICCYIGQYGPLVRCTFKGKYKYAALGDLKIEEVTLDEAVVLLQYPKELGKYKNKMVTIKKGKNGIYLTHNKKNYSIDQDVSLIEAEDIIKISDNNFIKKINEDIVIKKGKYGPYIHYKKKHFISIKTDPELITEKECLELVKRKFQ